MKGLVEGPLFVGGLGPEPLPPKIRPFAAYFLPSVLTY